MTLSPHQYRIKLMLSTLEMLSTKGSSFHHQLHINLLLWIPLTWRIDIFATSNPFSRTKQVPREKGMPNWRLIRAHPWHSNASTSLRPSHKPYSTQYQIVFLISHWSQPHLGLKLFTKIWWYSLTCGKLQGLQLTRTYEALSVVQTIWKHSDL